ncbi:MAG: GNAT family protein [Pyrinomonadaceae bacterium]
MMKSINNIAAAALSPCITLEMPESSSADAEDAAPGKHEIRTPRLYLRAINDSDKSDFIEIFSCGAVMRFVGLEAGCIPSYEEIDRMHKLAVQAWETRGYGRWSMFDLESGEYIGFCGFRCEEGIPDLICAMHEKFWGQELACEAAKACVKYGFEKLGFTEVKAYTRPEHNRARRVVEKLGSKFLGCVDFHGVEGAAYHITKLPD